MYMRNYIRFQLPFPTHIPITVPYTHSNYRSLHTFQLPFPTHIPITVPYIHSSCRSLHTFQLPFPTHIPVAVAYIHSSCRSLHTFQLPFPTYIPVAVSYIHSSCRSLHTFQLPFPTYIPVAVPYTHSSCRSLHTSLSIHYILKVIPPPPYSLCQALFFSSYSCFPSPLSTFFRTQIYSLNISFCIPGSQNDLPTWTKQVWGQKQNKTVYNGTQPFSYWNVN